MPSPSISRFAVGVLLTSLAACGGERAVQGECQTVFGGDVCTWGTMVGDDVTEFGATVALASVENAPPGGAMTFPPVPVGIVALPDEVVQATGFDHLGVHWEPHGHPPGLFLTPHFDFHFYTVNPDRASAIDCTDTRTPTNAPAEYTLPDIEIPGLGTLVGLCVPSMGMHAMLKSELDVAEPFGASMILGYYEQKLIFVEPMIAQAKLLQGQSFSLDVPAVQDPGANVKWPASFNAVYDETTRTYRFIFSGFPTE